MLSWSASLTDFLSLLRDQQLFRPLDAHDTGVVDDNLDDAELDPFDLLLDQGEPACALGFSVHTRTLMHIHKYVN